MKRVSFAIAVLFLILPAAYGQTNETKYQKWLKEDVDYLIEPSEKKTFLALKTDVEREHFIKEFWQRRDPSPDTEENEYRDEYYERIAYANKHFGFGNVAGWRADRGRVYILWGEPNEKQKTLTGETWKYKYVPGVGADQVLEFVRASWNHRPSAQGWPLSNAPHNKRLQLTGRASQVVFFPFSSDADRAPH